MSEDRPVTPCPQEHFQRPDGFSRLTQDRCGGCGHVLAVHGFDRVCDVCFPQGAP